MDKQIIIDELESLERRKNQLNNFSTIILTLSIPRDIELDIKREIGREIEICEEQINQINNDLPLIKCVE